MYEVLHPRAVDGVAGQPPDRVTVWGETYECDGETVTLPDGQHIAELARAYGLSPAEISLANIETCDEVKSDGEVCGRGLPCPYHD